MSKTQVEVVFGFIGEELAGVPIPGKPGRDDIRIEMSDSGVSAKYYDPRAGDKIRITPPNLGKNRQFKQEFKTGNYPIRRLQVVVKFEAYRVQQMTERDLMKEVLSQMAYQLAQELVPLLKVERQDDFPSDCILYGATLAVVDPSVIADSVNVVKAKSADDSALDAARYYSA